MKRKIQVENTGTVYNTQYDDLNIEKSKEKIFYEHNKFFENDKTAIAMEKLTEQKTCRDLINSFLEVFKKNQKPNYSF